MGMKEKKEEENIFSCLPPAVWPQLVLGAQKNSLHCKVWYLNTQQGVASLQ